jgi:hypothetical protein
MQTRYQWVVAFLPRALLGNAMIPDDSRDPAIIAASTRRDVSICEGAPR